MKKEKNNISSLSFILFIIVVAMSIFALYVDTTGFLIAAVIWVGFVPFIISIILAIISIITFFKDKKDSKPTKSRTILTSINIIQLTLCIVLVFDFGVSKLMNTIRFEPVKKELDKLYSNNYKIVDTCRVANSGGTNEIIAIIKLKSENMYSLCKYDLRDNEFIDYYNNIKKAEQINPDKYFDKDIVWVGSLREDYYDNNDRLDLSIIVNYKDYSVGELANTIKSIADDYIQSGYDKEVSIKIFFTDNINYSKLDNYKLLLTSQLEIIGWNIFDNFSKNLVYEKHYYDFFYDNANYDLEEISSLLEWIFIENGIK